MDSEENATSCSVCREIYSDPRSLACGHSFCLKCLKRIAGNDKRFPCPICRRYVDLRGTNVDQLPKNFVLCNVIEAREKKHPSMCLDHNKSLDLFCQGCDEVICSKCMSMQHKGHAIEDIEIIYIERNKQYGEFLERTKHFTSMIEEQRYDVQQSRILMEKNIDSISNRVDNTFKKWNDALQKQHNAICSYLHQERECKKQMFVEAERILAGSMTTVTRLDTEINKLRSKGTAVVVQQYGSIKARQEDTERKILQDIQTCSTPPDNLVLEVYAPWIEEAINNIKHIDMKQTQARPGRQKIAEIQEENVILKRECEKLQNTVQELKKSNQNGSGGQVDGKKGDMQKTPMSGNQNGPGGQGDGKKGGTQQSKSNGTGGQGDDKKGGMQQTPSSPNNMAGPVDGTKGSGFEPPSSRAMGDKKGLQKLGEEFCEAVKKRIQTKYPDVQEALNNLMKLIQNKKDARSISNELDLIENLLKERKESSPLIRECAKKIRNFWDVNKGQKTGTTDKRNNHPSKPKSSQSDPDLRLKGKAIAQTKETTNSDAVDNVTNFFEQLLSALHDLLKNNITDASKANLPSVPAASDKELGKKLKDMHAKVEETTKLCMDKNRELTKASEFLNELYKKAAHVDEGHVTDQVKNKSSRPPDLSEKTRQNRMQGHSPVPAKQESGEISNLDEKFARILVTWNKIEEAKEDVELASKLFADLSKLAKATSTDSGNDSEDRSNDRSDERENKGVLGTGNGGAIVPSQIDRSPKFLLDFELVKTTLIQKKDSQRLIPAVKEEKYQQYESADRKKLEEEVKSLRMRLSELAGAKLYKDNPNIVDLSDPNRPTKLKDNYCEIYSNEWMDAYQKLSESKPKRSEANIIKFLLDILLEGFKYCTQIRDIQRIGLLEVILYPMGDYGKSQVKKENVEINDILARHLAEVPKLSGDMTGEQVAKAFFWKKDMREKFGPDFETNETYIIQCVKLCWLMQVQTPPVCIDLAAKPGDKFDNETYKEYTKKGKKIDFIVWPPLRRNEGGDLIEKGVAQGK